MKILRNYKNTRDYKKYQTEEFLKTELENRHNEKRNDTVNQFRFKYDILFSSSVYEKVLCIGSRYGEEVEALQLNGFKDVTGIDLVNYPPYTIKMDMHNLKFNDDTFDIIYTNSLDHSLDLKKVISEMYRVINKDNGVIVIDLELFNYGKYENILFETIFDIKDIFDELGISYGFNDYTYIKYFLINNKLIPHLIDNKFHTLCFRFNTDKCSILEELQ